MMLSSKIARPTLLAGRILLIIGAVIVAVVLVWQGVVASGNPNPTAARISPEAAIVNTGILVFREGLECILVLMAITASMMGKNQNYRRPIAIGSGIGFGAVILTWFAVVGLLSALSNNVSALNIQAATGLLAIIVLLVIMNWFFHKIYWTGWISMQNKRKKELLSQKKEDGSSQSRLMSGLILLGFASVYREGFEVVLFLQTLRLQVGSLIVLYGVLIGLVLTAIVGSLTFVLHHRLPYKKMLVLTGVMLGAVLLVMVGEQAQEMQLAHWISTTPVNLPIPEWMGLWFAIFPTVETLVAQALAGIVVIGSYFLARYQTVWQPRKRGETPAQRPEQPPVATREPSEVTA
ncbi:FTR1 family iron permease [Dictyobacter alpinus]|nr:FTR1 family protein [Dictyobacter alpinus]